MNFLTRPRCPFVGPDPMALFLWGLALFLASCTGPEPAVNGSSGSTSTGDPEQRVVLVIIDGLRYSEGLGDPQHRWTPRMAALAAQGAIVEPFRNNGVTVTWRGIPAIWTGTWSEPERFNDASCGGSNNNRATAPTVFEYYRRHLGRPAEDCIYALGNIPCPWRASDVEGYGTDYWPVYDTDGGSTDTERWERGQEILATQAPGFLLFYLPDVDHYGHEGDWDGYLNAISIADGIVGDLWDTLQANPAYAGRTTLIVTNDHGRHDDRENRPHGGFSAHGDSCNGCRRIQLLMVGPSVKPGLVSTVPRGLIDITPTIGALLGFPTPLAEGQVMTELLVQP